MRYPQFSRSLTALGGSLLLSLLLATLCLSSAQAADDAKSKEVPPQSQPKEVEPAGGASAGQPGSAGDADVPQDAELKPAADDASEDEGEQEVDEIIDAAFAPEGDADSSAGTEDAAAADDSADEELDLDEEIDLDEDEAAVEIDEESGEIDLGSGDVEGEAFVATEAAPAAVAAVISEEEIAQSGVDSVGDLLAQEAGFSLTDSFSGSEISFQGLPSKFTTILIDGQRVPGRIAERIDSGQLPLSNIDHIEILRGPQAAAYGSESAGVIVNIITRKAGRSSGSAVADSEGSTGGKLQSLTERQGDCTEVGSEISGSLALEGGSLNFNRQQLGLQGSGKNSGWYLSAERKSRDAYDFNLTFPDTDGDGYTSYDFFGKYDRAIGKDAFGLQLDWYTEDALGLSYSPPDQIRHNETFTRRFSGNINYTWDLGRGRSLSASQSYGSYYHNLDRFYIDFPEETLVTTGFRDVLMDSKLAWLQYGKDYILRAGLERSFDKLESDRISGATADQPGTADAQILAGYASYEWFADKRWALSLAARYDDHDFFGGQFTPKFSAEYKTGAHSTLMLGAGQGFRAPSLRERFYEFASPFGYSVIGNSNLQPETSTDYTLGARWNYKLKSLDITAFRHSIENLIVFSQIQETPQVFQTANVGRALSSGLQLSAQQRWWVRGARECNKAQWFQAGIDGVWIAQSEDSELGTRLPGSPELDLSLRLAYEWPGASLSSLVRRSGSRFLDRENLSEAPAFSTLDLTYSQDMGDGQWRLSALNVFDEKNGRYGPEPGREIRVGYTLDF